MTRRRFLTRTTTNGVVVVVLNVVFVICTPRAHHAWARATTTRVLIGTKKGLLLSVRTTCFVLKKRRLRTARTAGEPRVRVCEKPFLHRTMHHMVFVPCFSLCFRVCVATHVSTRPPPPKKKRSTPRKELYRLRRFSAGVSGGSCQFHAARARLTGHDRTMDTSAVLWTLFFF